LTSRGCPYNCSFCHNSYRTLPFRFNTPEKVIEEIKLLVKNYDINAIFFVEDNLFVNRQRVRKICELLIKENLGIIWGANARVDNIDDDTLKLAYQAGCRQVTFGWESGSQRILDILNKRTTVEQNYESVRMCNRAGIAASGTLMIGNPSETVEDIRLTQKFMEESDIKGGIGICITTPYPGTKLWDWCIETGRVPEDFRWDEFDFHHVPIKVCDIPDDVFNMLVSESINMAVGKFVNKTKLSMGDI
jgi:radical SAM superfamily enzyme YgiQ (UPF0313 family)